MDGKTLTVNDALFIFPTDFIQSLAAQQIGESFYWTAKDHAQILLIETYKEDKQLKLAINSLNLCLRDGLHVCGLENLVRSPECLDFKDFRLRQMKNNGSFSTDIIRSIPESSKEEIKGEPKTLSEAVVESQPKRKRGRPRKTEAEKQASKNHETPNRPTLENTDRRYTLRGVKLSAEIMNAEKGIYKVIKKEEESVKTATESNTFRGNSLSDSKRTELSEKLTDEREIAAEKGAERDINEIIADNLDEHIENEVVTGDGDSEDDFLPKKKGKRGRPKIPQRKENDNIKPKKRKVIDIGNVPKYERRKRNNEKKEECKVCKKKLCDYTGLFNHVKKKHGKAQCYQSYLDELKELMVATCEKCGVKFANRNLLYAHEDREHRQSEIVECFRCNKSFRNIMNLRNHIRAVHVMKGDKNKLCHLCPAKFKWAATLKQHLDEIHEGNKHAKCQYCEKMFYSNSQLRRHERCHGLHQSKFVVCQQCGRKFLFNHNLKRHTEIMHGSKQEIYHCSYCGRGYNTKTSMVSHVQLVHFNLFSYACKQCSATFSRSKFLVDHMRTVHKVENYQVTVNPKERYKYRKNSESAFYCSYCSEGFNYKAKMVDHIHTVHADVFPYHCDRCTQGFLELSFLTNHRLKAHGIAPTEAGDAQSDGVSQELNSTVLVTTAGGDNLFGTEDISTAAIIAADGENSHKMTLIETLDQNAGGERTEPAMSDTAAASLLVEVASGNKTYQYYIETQEGVGEDGAVTVNPQDIANVLMMAEQTIQAEGGAVSGDPVMAEGQEGEGVGVGMGVGIESGLVLDYSQQGMESVVVEAVHSSHERETIIMQGTDTNQENLEALEVHDTRTVEFGTVESNDIKNVTSLQTADIYTGDDTRYNERDAGQQNSETAYIINVPYTVT